MKPGKKKTPGWFTRQSFAVLIFVVLCALFLGLQKAHLETRRSLEKARYELVNRLVSEQLNRVVEYQIKVLQILARRYETIEPRLDATFIVAAGEIISSFSNFLTINRVTPQGTITVAVPKAPNATIIGRNLLQRADVRHFLTEAFETRAPRLSNAIPLYQGGLGLVSYLPMFTAKGEFLGWTNGVFRIENLMRDFIARNDFKDVFLQLRFLNQKEPFYASHDTGADSDRAFDSVQRFKIMNQDLEISIRMEDGGTHFEKRVDLIITVTVLLVSLFIAYLFWHLLNAQTQLKERLHRERFDNVMLNILTHDLVNDSLAIKTTARVAVPQATGEVRTLLERILNTTEGQSGLLARVRDMRAVDSGNKRMIIEHVPVKEIHEKSASIFDDRLKAKNLTFTCEIGQGAEKLPVDRLIFQNTVVNNLVSNAVKFSLSGKSIRLRTYRGRNAFVLEISDEGIGMTRDRIKGLFLENLTASTDGTMGELGTGLGMLQIKAYMDFIGGRIEVESRDQRQHSDNHGTTFILHIPYAGKDR